MKKILSKKVKNFKRNNKIFWINFIYIYIKLTIIRNKKKKLQRGARKRYENDSEGKKRQKTKNNVWERYHNFNEEIKRKKVSLKSGT